MLEPARVLRPAITEKRLSETGCSGAPTFTSALSVRSSDRYASRSSGADTVVEVPPANWTAGVYAAGTRLCLSKDLVSSGVTYP